MFKAETYRKGIVLSTVANVISKFLFFLQGVAIAYYFGAQSKTDVYFYFISFIVLVAYFVNSLDSSVLIPESMRISQQVSMKESMKFLNFFFCLYLFAGALCTLVFYVDPVKIFSVLSDFETEVLVSNRDIIFLSLPLFTLSIITGLMGNIMASYKYFTIPPVVAFINNFFALAFLFLFHDRYNILSIYFGLLFGFTVNMVMLVYLMKKYIGWDFFFRYYPVKGNILRNIFFALTGNVMSLLSSFVPLYALSGYGAGVISSLNFGQKTAEAPNQLTVQFSSVLGIKFNEQYAQQQWYSLNNTFLASSKILFFILVPFSCIMFLFDKEIISLLFQRGAFDEESANLSSNIFALFVLLLPLYGLNTVIARLFMAGQRVRELFFYQFFLNLMCLVLIVAGIKYLGVLGYPISLVVAYMINIFTAYIWLRFVFPFISYSGIFLYITRICLTNGLIGLLIFWLKQFLPEILLLNIISGICIYFILLLGANYVFNLNKDVTGYLKPMAAKFNSICAV